MLLLLFIAKSNFLVLIFLWIDVDRPGTFANYHLIQKLLFQHAFQKSSLSNSLYFAEGPPPPPLSIPIVELNMISGKQTSTLRTSILQIDQLSWLGGTVFVPSYRESESVGWNDIGPWAEQYVMVLRFGSGVV